MTIFIDKEMEALIPPLSEEELDQLDENILEEGIRDPLITWPQPDGREMLIDGHHRYSLANIHDLPFKVVQKHFADRDEAKVWIIKNQLGRRNLSAYDRSLLALKLKPAIAEKAKERMMSGKTNPNQKSDDGMTSTALGKIAGVSHDTIHKVETIEKKASDKTKQLVRSGKLSINQAYNSVHEKRPDPVKQAKEAHERFEESKAGGVVDFKAAQVDKINQQIINDALYQEFLKFIVRVNNFVLIHTVKELETMIDNIPDDERSYYGQQIGDCMTALGTIRAKIEWRNHGRN